MAHAHCGLRSVQINDLYVAHQGLRVLDGINLTVHCGGLTALIGRNGAGKTTLLRALLGETTYQGKVLFLDEGGTRWESRRWAMCRKTWPLTKTRR